MAHKAPPCETMKQQALKKLSDNWLFTSGKPPEKTGYQKAGAKGSAAGVKNRNKTKCNEKTKAGKPCKKPAAYKRGSVWYCALHKDGSGRKKIK